MSANLTSQLHESTKVNLGIDVSKDKCDCHLSALSEALWVKAIAAKTFANTDGGLMESLAWLKKHCPAEVEQLHVTLEATGVYHERFAPGLQQAGHRVSVVLPNKAKKYLESLGQKSKNDAVDAKGLATTGCQQQLICRALRTYFCYIRFLLHP